MPQAFPFDIQSKESDKNLGWKDRTLRPECFNSLCCHKHISGWSGFPGTCQVKLWKAQRTEISLPFWDCVVVLHHSDFVWSFSFFGLSYLNLIPWNKFLLLLSFQACTIKNCISLLYNTFRWWQSAAKLLLNILFPRLNKLLPSVSLCAVWSHLLSFGNSLLDCPFCPSCGGKCQAGHSNVDVVLGNRVKDHLPSGCWCKILHLCVKLP